MSVHFVFVLSVIIYCLFFCCFYGLMLQICALTLWWHDSSIHFVWCDPSLRKPSRLIWKEDINTFDAWLCLCTLLRKGARFVLVFLHFQTNSHLQYFSCLGECCNAVFLWSSINVHYETSSDFPGWVDKDWIFGQTYALIFWLSGCHTVK